MNKMEIIDEILESCQYDENYELDDVIEKFEKFILAQHQVKNLSLGGVSICTCGTEEFSKPKEINTPWECGKCNKPY